jgi:hypothetical protein
LLGKGPMVNAGIMSGSFQSLVGQFRPCRPDIRYLAGFPVIKDAGLFPEHSAWSYLSGRGQYMGMMIPLVTSLAGCVYRYIGGYSVPLGQMTGKVYGKPISLRLGQLCRQRQFILPRNCTIFTFFGCLSCIPQLFSVDFDIGWQYQFAVLNSLLAPIVMHFSGKHVV